MTVVSHPHPRVQAARRSPSQRALPWLISLASLAMLVSAWCWQFVLSGPQSHHLAAATMAAASLDDPAAAAPDRAATVDQAPAGQRLDTGTEPVQDSPAGHVALVAPLVDQLVPVQAPRSGSDQDTPTTRPAPAGARAPPVRS